MSRPPYIEEVAVRLGGAGVSVELEASFSRLTTFRVGGPAALLAEPEDDEQLGEIARAVIDEGCDVIVIGRGSNILMSDHGFDGIVVRLGRGFAGVEVTGTRMEVGAAVPLPQAANRAARASLAGLEFGVAIPGSAGGAVRMNAGAHSSCIADVLIAVSILDMTTSERVKRSAEDLGLSYRHSDLDDTSVVTQLLLGLTSGAPEEIAARMQANRDHRVETQPVDAPNAGSMFANPPNDSAGRLIEASGAKESAVGGAQVSQKHANFFMARQGASAQDVFDLMAMVQEKVESKTGVLLRPEVRVIGRFTNDERLKRPA